MNNTVTPKLSVLLVTYNHERFVRQALDSVLMQKTDFDFEIVVADDCSPDSTLAIVAEYQTDNQSIRVIPCERNVGITRNYQRGFASCRGEYVAVLEGDDFWISPNKLQTMSMFLDQHQECSLCFHQLIRHDELINRFTIHPAFAIKTEFDLLSASQLASGNFIGGFSVCTYRREVIDRLDPALFEMTVYDWMFNLTVAQEGMIGYVPTVMSIYRAHPAGVWSGKTLDEWRPELLELIDIYNKYLDFKFDSELQVFKSGLLAEISPPLNDCAPKVSVLLVTYNHRKYIRQALESVLSQEADFDFEIIVADDYSTDSTRSIIEEYQGRDQRIRVLPNPAGKVGITRNYQRGFEACRGKYIAVIEGDDYWISRKKLQSISTFMDVHEECSLCFHKIIRHDEVSEQAAVYPAFSPAEESDVFTASQLAKGNFIGGFSTCVYRSETIATLDPRIWKMKVREWLFNIAVAAKGSIGYVPEIMSIYRVHPEGIWSLKPQAEKATELLGLIDSYNEYLNFKFDLEFRGFKRKLLLDTGFRRLTEATESIDAGSTGRYHKARRLLKPFIPPILLNLARKIYSRTPRRA